MTYQQAVDFLTSIGYRFDATKIAYVGPSIVNAKCIVGFVQNFHWEEYMEFQINQLKDRVVTLEDANTHLGSQIIHLGIARRKHDACRQAARIKLLEGQIKELRKKLADRVEAHKHDAADTRNRILESRLAETQSKLADKDSKIKRLKEVLRRVMYHPQPNDLFNEVRDAYYSVCPDNPEDIVEGGRQKIKELEDEIKELRDKNYDLGALIKQLARKKVYIVHGWDGLKIGGHKVIGAGGKLYDEGGVVRGHYYSPSAYTIIIVSEEEVLSPSCTRIT